MEDLIFFFLRDTYQAVRKEVLIVSIQIVDNMVSLKNAGYGGRAPYALAFFHTWSGKQVTLL